MFLNQTNILYLFCSQLGFIQWLQNHLLPCPFKFLTGMDCPGCGYQRAMMAFIQGDFSGSWALYPPAVPLTVFLLYGIADSRFKLDNSRHLFKKSLYVVVGSMVVINYGLKVWHLLQNYHSHQAFN